MEGVEDGGGGMSPDAGRNRNAEAVAKAAILAALGRRPDCMVWNHPTGTGVPIHEVPEHFRRRVVAFGLAGSADIIGVRAVTITPEMVGQVIGQAVAVEVKRPASDGVRAGQQRLQQRRFQAAFEKRGGLYVVAHSAGEAIQAVESAKTSNLRTGGSGK